MSPEGSSGCPFHATNRDERKSARIAAANVLPEPGARLTASFALARDVFRSTAVRQAGLEGGDWIKSKDPSHRPVIFLDGELHRNKRAAIARFFTPKAINTRYRAVMEQTTDALLAGVRKKGRGRLDDVSFQLAVIVAAEILGLDTSNLAGLSKRVEAPLTISITRDAGWLKRLIASILRPYYALRFFTMDVKPAIKARRKQRADDVISDLIDDGYSDQGILIECMTYGAAGMVTTREFITMAAWHMFEKDDLRQRFLAGDESDQIAILEEILRLEPVAAMLHRRVAEPATFVEAGAVAPDTVFAIDIRTVNADEAVTGPCPNAIDPDRAKRMKVGGSYMSFGDGAHRCPGAQVALHECRIFLDRLFRVPGIRLERAPDMGWDRQLMAYELRNAIIACDVA